MPREVCLVGESEGGGDIGDRGAGAKQVASTFDPKLEHERVRRHAGGAPKGAGETERVAIHGGRKLGQRRRRVEARGEQAAGALDDGRVATAAVRSRSRGTV